MTTNPHGCELKVRTDNRPPRTPFGARTAQWWRLRLTVQIASAVAVMLAFALVPGLFKLGGPWLLYPTAVIAALAVPTVIVLPRMWSRYNRWEVTDRAAYVRTGWLWCQRKVVPLNRIQTVDINFGPLQHVLGLCTLTVTTAATKDDLGLEGLERAEAERLLTQLTSKRGIAVTSTPVTD
ncbi:PH domain-containing protein [Rhodococcus qingshengii]|uniref:PH domain-containing protein n=1 Tax=Rhodococcus qingshengii TaxID=334542 RepID=UPI0036DBFDF9